MCQTRAGVSGSWLGMAPNEAKALATALAMRPPIEMIAPSPAPLTPSGLLGDRWFALAADGLRVTTAFGNDNRLTYTYGSAAAHVAVDPGTGDVEVLDCLVVEDVGRVVNPLTLHGQAIGGMVQGLGGAFLEHLVYDANGQLLAGNLTDYLIPTATDFPKIRAIALENHRSPSNPLGVKGAGEGAILSLIHI